MRESMHPNHPPLRSMVHASGTSERIINVNTLRFFIRVVVVVGGSGGGLSREIIKRWGQIAKNNEPRILVHIA